MADALLRLRRQISTRQTGLLDNNIRFDRIAKHLDGRRRLTMRHLRPPVHWTWPLGSQLDVIDYFQRGSFHSCQLHYLFIYFYGQRWWKVLANCLQNWISLGGAHGVPQQCLKHGRPLEVICDCVCHIKSTTKERQDDRLCKFSSRSDVVKNTLPHTNTRACMHTHY